MLHACGTPPHIAFPKTSPPTPRAPLSLGLIPSGDAAIAMSYFGFDFPLRTPKGVCNPFVTCFKRGGGVLDIHAWR